MSDEATSSYELLEGGPPASRGRSRGGRTLTVAGIVVALVLAGSAVAAYQLLRAGGPQPAEALPASTLAMVSIDLDPSAGQKIEAIRTIRKFPGLKEELGLQADDDLRRKLVEQLIDENGCDGLDYSTDVEPWIGKRAAFAAVDLGGDVPVPVLTLQVTDRAEAEAGFRQVAQCVGQGEDVGFTVTDDYLIASDSTAHARAVADRAAKGALADDAGYVERTDSVGDAGVLSFYVARRAAQYFADHYDDLLGEAEDNMGGSLSGGGPGLPAPDLQEAVEEFQGLAGTVRFADGGMEIAAVGAGAKQDAAPTVGNQVGDLPGDTAAVLALGVPGDFVQEVLDQLRSTFGDDVDAGVRELEDQTGLEVPDDVQALLGTALSVSLGGDAPKDLAAVSAPSEVPLGLLVSGDEKRIDEVIGKLEQSSGSSLADLEVVHKSAPGKVVLASSDAYADALLDGDGDLAADDAFGEVVPEAGRATSVFFLDFDSRWTDAIIDAYGSDTGEDTGDVRANVDPLRAFGMSSWQDGRDAHVLVKLTTD